MKRRRSYRPSRNTQDGVGTVRIIVALVDPIKHQAIKGNICRSYTVRHSTVSIVAQKLDHLIYGAPAEILEQPPEAAHA